MFPRFYNNETVHKVDGQIDRVNYRHALRFKFGKLVGRNPVLQYWCPYDTVMKLCNLARLMRFVRMSDQSLFSFSCDFVLVLLLHESSVTSTNHLGQLL